MRDSHCFGKFAGLELEPHDPDVVVDALYQFPVEGSGPLVIQAGQHLHAELVNIRPVDRPEHELRVLQQPVDAGDVEHRKRHRRR